MTEVFTIIIPTLNEEKGLPALLADLNATFQNGKIDYEIIVVNDNSQDASARVAEEAGAKVISHAATHGYGQSIRTGLAHSKGDLVGIIDGDGTYLAQDLLKLYEDAALFDMVVGVRSGVQYRGTHTKYFFRKVLIKFCEFVTGTRIPDINSGLRIFRKSDVNNFLGNLSFGFSFTTSLTICYLLNGHFVGYRDIQYLKRSGSSKVRHFIDTLRTIQIVFEAFARYNPLKLYLSLAIFDILCFVALLFCIIFHIGKIEIWIVTAVLIQLMSILAALSFIAVQLAKRATRPYRKISKLRI